MRWVGVALIALIAACGSPTPGQGTAATSPPSLLRAASLAPTTIADSFACRLPVMMVDMSGTMTGGFVAFPGGNYSADPEGTFTMDQSTGTFRWLSTKQPQLIGTY